MDFMELEVPLDIQHILHNLPHQCGQCQSNVKAKEITRQGFGIAMTSAC